MSPVPDFVLALRDKIGHDPLWLPGVTAVVRRADQVLLVRRADDGSWTPITGISDPGEEPAVTAAREALEETGVRIRVDRLASTGVYGEVVHANGDRATYLDLTFACTWLDGEAHVADDESSDVRWWPLSGLPPMSEVTGLPIVDVRLPGPAVSYTVDISLARRLLGFAPRYDFASMLREAGEAYHNRLAPSGEAAHERSTS